MRKKVGWRPVLALDLGGTKILASIISEEGRIVADKRFPTMAARGPEEVVGRVIAAAEDILKQENLALSQIDSISIAAAGTVKGNVLTASPNLPGWRNIALGDIVRERFGVETFLIHDGNAAALAEQRFGAAKGVRDFIYLTVSTGIGGGIIIDGRLYTGASGSAGEVGHMTIDVNGPPCPCGNIGCLEMLASGKAVAREAIKRINRGEKSALIDMVQGQVEDITAEKIDTAARGGDALALDVIRAVANYLGIGMVNLVNIFNPALIVVGGGMSKMHDLLLEPARQLVSERAFAQSAEAVTIVTARLGDSVGVLGAAIYAYQQGEGKGEAT